MKNLLQLTIVSLIITGFLTGCGSLPSQSHQPRQVSHPAKPLKFNSQQQAEMHQQLEQQFRNWKGTPYRLGGMTRNGIDCSGFVHVAFRDGLGMNIPRSTKNLANRGRHIAKHQLDIGDLVFFKTGFGKRHVGIYVGNQQFIHASTSNGVMKSSLNNPYWAEHYWKSTRLIAN